MESFLDGSLVELLHEQDISISGTSMRRKGSHLGEKYEFDIIANNGIEIVIVVVKTTLGPDDVKEFVF